MVHKVNKATDDNKIGRATTYTIVGQWSKETSPQWSPDNDDLNAKKRWGVRRREEVHPGRDLVRIIRPHFSGFVPCGIRPFEGERVNIHGLSPKPRRYFHNTTNELDCTHDDLNRVLTMLDVKKFRSKKKSDKI